jgi:hypothetical protein
MKNSRKYLQIFILAIVMGFGITIGTSFEANADEPVDCGICDYDSGTGLWYCNMAYNPGECGGNDGGSCGGVVCEG